MNDSFDEIDRGADRQIVFKARIVPDRHCVDWLRFAATNGWSCDPSGDLSGKEFLNGKICPVSDAPSSGREVHLQASVPSPTGVVVVKLGALADGSPASC
jgi:hypothetical protein